MKKIIIVVAASGLLMPAIASAELNYNAVQIGYAKTTESGEADLNSYGVGVSYSVNSNIYIQGQFSTAKQASGTPAGDITGTAWGVGIGAHTPISNNVDVIGSFDYAHVNSELGTNSVSGNGYDIGVGLRGEFTPQLEGSLSVDYASVTANSSTTTSTGIGAGLGYNFTPQFQLRVGISSDSYNPDIGPSYNTQTIAFAGRFFY
jgi:long-subunit fatty acid transport protein